METPPPIRTCGSPKASADEFLIIQKYDEPTKLDFQTIREEISRLEKELLTATLKFPKEMALQRYRDSLENMYVIKQAYYRVNRDDPPKKSTSCCSYGC